MITEYGIDLRHQLRSFRECFYLLAWYLCAFTVGQFLIEDIDKWTLFVILILFWLITSVGFVLPFHVNYLIANWQTKLIIDANLKTIRLIESGQIYDFKFSNIKVTRHILGYYRPDRTKSWTPIPFDYYGYLVISTDDNKEIYLTSLMLDPFKPPLPVNRTEYGFPVILKTMRKITATDSKE